MAMAKCSALLALTSLQFGWGLRADHALHSEHHGELAESLESSGGATRVTAGQCCCYQPVTWHVYTNPFGAACPLEGDKWWRGCVEGLGKAAPCALAPTKYDVYCQIYHALDCDSKLRSPTKIMWNKAWESRYRDMTLRNLQTGGGWDDMARRPLYNITGRIPGDIGTTTRPWIQGFDMSVLDNPVPEPWDE